MKLNAVREVSALPVRYIGPERLPMTYAEHPDSLPNTYLRRHHRPNVK
jgi:hypothetical protein